MWNWDYFTIKLLEQFVALVGHVAWPVAVVLIVWMLRKQIGELFQRIRRARWGDGELSFEEKKDEVTARVLAANSQPQAAPTTISFDSNPFEDDPDTIVLRAWTKVEATIDGLVQQAGGNAASMKTIFDKLAFLTNANLVNELSAKSVEGLFQLRQLARRGVDLDKAHDFAVLAEATLYALSMNATKTQK